MRTTFDHGACRSEEGVIAGSRATVVDESLILELMVEDVFRFSDGTVLLLNPIPTTKVWLSNTPYEGVPMIGFLGTVLGISLGLSGAWEVMSDVPAIRELALQRLTSAFALAFDSTLMSLVLVLLLLSIRNVVFVVRV